MPLVFTTLHLIPMVLMVLQTAGLYDLAIEYDNHYFAAGSTLMIKGYAINETDRHLGCYLHAITYLIAPIGQITLDKLCLYS